MTRCQGTREHGSQGSSGSGQEIQRRTKKEQPDCKSRYGWAKDRNTQYRAGKNARVSAHQRTSERYEEEGNKRKKQLDTTGKTGKKGRGGQLPSRGGMPKLTGKETGARCGGVSYVPSTSPDRGGANLYCICLLGGNGLPIMLRIQIFSEVSGRFWGENLKMAEEDTLRLNIKIHELSR